MKIVQFNAENIKRLKVVEIKPDGNLVEITGRNGQGKQQPISEPVLTPAGWRPIGSINIGDWVIGATGYPTKVTGVFPQVTRETYKVVMADGASTRCGPDHLWTVSRWKERSGEKERVIETIATSEIIHRGIRRGASRKWSVPVVDAVQFDLKMENLPIDPYTLGVILGDGHIEPTGYVTVTSWDSEILDAIAPPECWREEKSIGSGYWSRPLQHLGLAGKRSWEKFIPESYLWASQEDRAALLAGLLDTDGTAPDSWASYCSTSESLADAVVHLGSSLGYVCKKGVGATKKYRYLGELKEGRTAWNVSIKSHESPFTLKRKSEAWSKSTQRGERWRFIDSIEKVEDEDSVCIQVEAHDGLYVTKDFILTHNTSVLDAIWWALEGTKHIQSTPIRKGAKSAHIKLDLGELVVTRTFSASKDPESTDYTTKIVVENKEGARFPGPQAVIDALLGELSFDPLHFTRVKPKEQFDLLRQFVPGVDFEEIEKQNKIDYDTRTNLNREIKSLRARAEVLTVDTTAPTDEIDVSAMAEELKKAGEHNAAIQLEDSKRKSDIEKLQSIEKQIGMKQQQVEQLKKEIEALVADAGKVEEKINSSYEDYSSTKAIDTSAIVAKMEEARHHNEKVQAIAQATKQIDSFKSSIEQLEGQADTLSDAIAQRNSDKEAAIAEAKMPVEGITFGDGAVLLNGVPFEQASDAEQLRASVAIAAAMNPKLRVIRVRDGSLLDDDAMKMMAEFADTNDLQIWIERVDSSGKVGFVLEDGELANG